MVAIRGTLGGVAVAGLEMRDWNVSREVAVVPCDRSQINPQFLAYWIATRTSQQWLTGVLKGVPYQGINLADLRRLDVPLLDRDRQASTVAELNEAREDTDRLAERYAQKRDALHEVKKRMLQKTFAGRLASARTRHEIPEAAE